VLYRVPWLPEKCLRLVDGLNINVQTKGSGMPHDDAKPVDGLSSYGRLFMPYRREGLADVVLVNFRYRHLAQFRKYMVYTIDH